MRRLTKNPDKEARHYWNKGNNGGASRREEAQVTQNNWMSQCVVNLISWGFWSMVQGLFTGIKLPKSWSTLRRNDVSIFISEMRIKMSSYIVSSSSSCLYLLIIIMCLSISMGSHDWTFQKTTRIWIVSVFLSSLRHSQASGVSKEGVAVMRGTGRPFNTFSINIGALDPIKN